MTEDALAEKLALYSTSAQGLFYPVQKLDWEAGVFTVMDLDTDTEIDAFIGRDKPTTIAAWSYAGFELGSYDDD